MNRAPDQLAPSWLPRQQRRHINYQLRRQMHRDVCSLCSDKLRHNTRTFSGLDAQGTVALAGECCADRIAELFGMGFFSHRKYDFLSPRDPESGIESTNKQITDAIAAYQEIIASTDKWADDTSHRGGVRTPSVVSLLDHPWKGDDRAWFEQNRGRSHRARMPFPSEADKEVAKTPAQHALIVLVRQVEPGARLKAGFYLGVDLLPVPDEEAITHALFEVVVRHEPVPRNGEALHFLIEKTRHGSRANDA